MNADRNWRRARSARFVAPVLLLAAPLAAQLGSPAPASAVVTLERYDGQRSTRALEETNLASLPAQTALIEFDAGSAPLDAPAAEDPARACVDLRNGDRLRGRVVDSRGETLGLTLAGDVHLDVALEDVRSLTFPGRLTAETLAGLQAADSGDLLHWIRPGDEIDRVPGTLLGFSADGIQWEGSFGKRSFPWTEVAGLFIEALGDPARPPASDGADEGVQGAAGGCGLCADVPVSIDLRDGSRLRGGLRDLNEGRVRLAWSETAELSVPPEVIAVLAVDDGSLRFLSDGEPRSAAEGSPFGDDLGLTWPHRRDESVGGTPLRAGKRAWPRGLGVHSPSRLVYELDGRWSALRGAVAIDDSVLLLAARGSVVFRIEVDGQERWKSDVVRGGDAPLEFPAVDLSGARELALVVDMADDLHVADRADWLRMTLVRLPR